MEGGDVGLVSSPCQVSGVQALWIALLRLVSSGGQRQGKRGIRSGKATTPACVTQAAGSWVPEAVWWGWRWRDE